MGEAVASYNILICSYSEAGGTWQRGHLSAISWAGLWQAFGFTGGSSEAVGEPISANFK